VVGLLEAMLDPVSVALAAAPIDDEPEKEEERQTASESQEWFRRHAGIPFEEVLADFGVTVNDLNDYKKPK